MVNLFEFGMFVVSSMFFLIGIMVCFCIDFGVGGGNFYLDEIVQGYGYVVWVCFSFFCFDELVGFGIEFGVLNVCLCFLLCLCIYEVFREMLVIVLNLVVVGG